MGFMRHSYRLIGSNREHHKAIFRNMVTSLIKHERIETTVPKAKELRKIADKVIGLAKLGNLHAYRQALAIVREKPMVDKLFSDLAARYIARDGGYTRIMRSRFRTADRAPMCYIEYIDRPNELRPASPPAKLSEPGVTVESLLKFRDMRINKIKKPTQTIPPGTKQTHLYKRDGALPKIYIKPVRRWLNGMSNDQMMNLIELKKKRQAKMKANLLVKGGKVVLKKKAAVEVKKL